MKPVLVLESGAEGMAVSIGKERVRHRKVAKRDALLATIDRTLKSVQLTGRQLHGIGVIAGTGSFSETRAVITIANALGYAFGIPIMRVESTGSAMRAFAQKGPAFVIAAYKGEPRITI